jgi:hypothetical protein
VTGVQTCALPISDPVHGPDFPVPPVRSLLAFSGDEVRKRIIPACLLEGLQAQKLKAPRLGWLQALYTKGGSR